MIRYFRSNRQPAIRLATVNVVEMANDEMQSVRSFVDNPEGNKQAEKLFKRLVKEHEALFDENAKSLPGDIQDNIEDGCYDDSGYQLFLTHSV